MSRLVAIGDIHADLSALIGILRGMDLVGDDGRWTARDAQIVLIGDLNDRGSDSVAVMHYAIDLQAQAQQAGGAVHALLGNHELLAVKQDYRYVRPVEYLEHERFWHGGVNGLDAIYLGSGPFATWIRGRPTLLLIDDTLFAHAGIDGRAAALGLPAVNRTVALWVSFFQGVAEAPDEATRWLVDQSGGGPLWQDALRVGKTDLSAELERDIIDALRRVGAARIVVGHAPTAQIGYRIAWPHPRFGERVAVIDTGISEFFGGRFSALEIADDVLTPRYFERGDSSAAAERRAVTRAYLAQIAE